MPQREVKSNKFSGFIAYYDNGKVVKEKELFYSTILKRNLATNWAEIKKERLNKLELHWNGNFKVSVSKEEFPFINPEDWFFSHSGAMDLKNRKVQVVSRNIGYKKDGILQIFSVYEVTGIVRIHSRAA